MRLSGAQQYSFSTEAFHSESTEAFHCGAARPPARRSAGRPPGEKKIKTQGAPASQREKINKSQGPAESWGTGCLSLIFYLGEKLLRINFWRGSWSPAYNVTDLGHRYPVAFWLEFTQTSIQRCKQLA